MDMVEKYRPKTLDELWSRSYNFQDLKDTLKRAICQSCLQSRWCGKTTTAIALAKEC